MWYIVKRCGMRAVSDFIRKYFAVIVLAVSALALFIPESCLWIQTGWISFLLAVVMFGMGLTMKARDFAIVFTRPKDVIIGCLAQYLIMPALAFGLGKIFGLSEDVLVGVILVGTCPGGTASNVITYLSNGDVALSVGMTSINTLLAVFLTPLLTSLYLGTSVKVNVLSMVLSIVQIILIPIGLGILVNKFFEKITKRVKDVLPVVSIIAMCLIMASVVSHNSEKIMTTGAVILVVVILHNLLGYLLGYLTGIVFRMNAPRKKAISIEIGMQNSGLATSLALSAFPDLVMATVPGAIFSVWHNISGAALASIFRRMDRKHDKE